MAVAVEERYTDTLPTEPSSEYKVFSNIPMVSKKTKKKKIVYLKQIPFQFLES